MTNFRKLRNEAIDKMAEETGSVYMICFGYEWIDDSIPRGHADVIYCNNLEDTNNGIRQALKAYHIVRTIVEFKDIEEHDFDEGNTIDAAEVETESCCGLLSIDVCVEKIR